MGKNRSGNHPTLGPVIRKLFTDLTKKRKSKAMVNRDEIMGLPWQGVRGGGKDLPGRGTEGDIAYAHSHPEHKQVPHGTAQP